MKEVARASSRAGGFSVGDNRQIVLVFSISRFLLKTKGFYFCWPEQAQAHTFIRIHKQQHIITSRFDSQLFS